MDHQACGNAQCYNLKLLSSDNNSKSTCNWPESSTKVNDEEFILFLFKFINYVYLSIESYLLVELFCPLGCSDDHLIDNRFLFF